MGASVSPTGLSSPTEPSSTVSALTGFDPSRIPWGHGSGDDSYGNMVWVSRIQNLDTHFKIIADYLPEDCGWLVGQLRAARAEAAGYIADYCPEAGLALDAIAPEAAAETSGEVR